MPINPFALFVTIPIVLLTVSFVQVIRTQSMQRKEALDFVDVGYAKRVGYRVSTIVLAGLYIMTGIPKLTGLFDLMHRFEQWGYSAEFMTAIGTTEFLAGIALLVPTFSTYAAAYLWLVMCGAIYTHLAFGEYPSVVLPLVCLSFLSFIVYENRFGNSDLKASE